MSKVNIHMLTTLHMRIPAEIIDILDNFQETEVWFPKWKQKSPHMENVVKVYIVVYIVCLIYLIALLRIFM